MKWIEAVVVFEAGNPEFAADLISNIFYDAGTRGVVIEEPDVHPAEGWAEDAPEKPNRHAVIGYIPDNEKSVEKIETLELELARLETRHAVITRTSFGVIDEEDWAESWKTYFWPVNVTSTFVVKPTWRDYEPEANEIIIEIDPGMAFGTGTHATTAMCISLIEEHVEPGQSFLDVGTGSGILMIAAARMGAGPLWGIDNDETAVEVADRNLRLNRIDPGEYRLMTGHLIDLVDQRFDRVAANILSEIIIQLLDDIENVLSPNGRLICSGIIEENADLVARKIKEKGLRIIEKREQEKWVAFVCARI